MHPRSPSLIDILLRLSSIIGPNGPIPVSKSTWWEGVRDGRFPQPVKISKKITAWRASDIAKLIETFESGSSSAGSTEREINNTAQTRKGFMK